MKDFEMTNGLLLKVFKLRMQRETWTRIMVLTGLSSKQMVRCKDAVEHHFEKTIKTRVETND